MKKEHKTIFAVRISKERAKLYSDLIQLSGILFLIFLMFAFIWALDMWTHGGDR